MITGNLNNIYQVVEESSDNVQTYTSPLVIVPNKNISPLMSIIKGGVDILGSVIGVIITLPIGIILSMLIKMGSKGPVIYSHERIGQFGKPFRIYKFRSMYNDAEENGPRLSSKNDTRITPIGRIMRRWHLDEIPNFINVFKGEMSLVGPRPERQFFINQIVRQTPEYIKLLQIKPGVTSLGEVEFGYAENVDEMISRMEYDLQYLNKISFWGDVLILLRSINVILKGKGV